MPPPSEFSSFLPSLALWQWGVAGLCAVTLGVCRAGFNGLYLLMMLGFTVAVPGRASAGALQPLLLIADFLVIGSVWRSVDWSQMRRVLPAALVGLGVGLLCLRAIPDRAFGRLVGGLILGLLAVQGLRGRWPGLSLGQPGGGFSASLLGGLSGMATMVANAASPILTLHLLPARLSKERFVATTVAFFFALNLIKLPINCSLGLITPGSLCLDALLVPLVMVGVWLGRTWLKRTSQLWFEKITLVLTLAAAVHMVLV